MKNKVLVFTIIAKNYYPQAATLAESYHKIHPDHQFFIFFVDNNCIRNPKVYQAIPIKKVTLIKNLAELSFKYNITEFSTAVKPYLFRWLFQKYSAQKILYFDPDIHLYKRIDRIITLLDQHDCVLIPHRTQPTNDNKKPNEWDFMGCGYYNLGFVGLKNNPQTKKFLIWWSKKLNDFAYSDLKNLMFTDQKWMDFAPSFLNTYVLRDRGYDVAYWNLHEYLESVPVSQVYFFHFSGFVPEKNILSKHQNRFTLDNIGEYRSLFDSYAERLQHFRKLQQSLISYTYPYNYFDNGTEISQTIKDIYRHATADLRLRFPNPYHTSSRKSFFAYLNKVIYVSNNVKLLNYFFLLNKTQPEISREFPLDQPYRESVFCAYITWLFSFSKSIYDIPEYFLSIQKKLSPDLSKSKFNHKIPLNYLESIIALERSKKNRDNPDFITDAYRIILHRQPDNEGHQKNLYDLDHLKASRNFFLLRLFNSPEFRYKHGNCLFTLLSPYRFWLFISTLKFILFDKALFIKTIKKKNERYFVRINKLDQIKNIGWNISGYLDTESGVGESARGLIRVFDKFGTPINLNNVEQPWLRREDKTFLGRFTHRHDHLINLICVNAEQVKPVIETQLGIDYVKNKYNIAYWYWESDIFPDTYEESFHPLNEIWTATTYVQSAISLKSPKPVVCIPPSFVPPKVSDIPHLNFSKYSLPVQDRDFIFLNIFDSASIWQRKNPFALIQAFSQAFKNKPHVKLIIKTTQIKKSDIYPKLQAEIEKNRQIHLLDGYLHSSEITSLLNSANCFVSLHRAEGLGIPLIQSHLLAKPVIATNFSANRDFESGENTFLVNYKPYILEKPIGPYPENTSWADPDPDHAAFQMRKVYDMATPLLTSISQKGKEQVARHFSPQRIAHLINQRLPIINQFF